MKLNDTIQGMAGNYALGHYQKYIRPQQNDNDTEKRTPFPPVDEVSKGKGSAELGQNILNGNIFISVKEQLSVAFKGEDSQSSFQFHKDMEVYGVFKGKDAIPTPEESAGKIVSFATGYYEMFKERHPEMSDEEATREFDRLIRGSIKKGVVDALKIIHGLKKDDEETMDRIATTLNKVEEGLQSFFSTKYKEMNGDDAVYTVDEKDLITFGVLNDDHAVVKDKTEKANSKDKKEELSYIDIRI